MIQIASWRAIASGFAAGAIGLAVFSAPFASADPLAPAPTIPTPAVPAQTGAGAPNRFVAAPQAPNAFLPSTPARTPGAPAAAPTPQPPAPAVSGTLRDYFQAKGVKLEAQKPQGFKPLDVTLPVPPRWTQVPDPNVPDAFAVIADRQGNSVYSSNAQVVVYRLVGNFDPKEAITHGYADSQKLLAWRTTNASMADFDGFPSSVIEGTYREGDMTLNTSRRNVIATSGHDKYLVSMSVTTDRSVARGDAPATNAILNGFRVAVPGAPASAAAQAAQPAAPPAAAQAVQPAAPPAAAQAAQPAPAPATAPAALPGQTPASTMPGQVAVTSQTSPSQGIPNLLALVPGLPPLPNINLGGPLR